jgi:hypothetical protein
MKRSIVALLLLAMTLAMATPADSTATPRTFFRIHNGTDKYVLITVSEKPNVVFKGYFRPWCIVPYANDVHEEAADIADVRAEVSAVGCTHTPKLLDKHLAVQPRYDPNGVVNFAGVVQHAGGVYTFTGQ